MPAVVFPELDGLIRDLLSSNRGPGYDVAVVGVASDFSRIDVELCFRAGDTYCCAEPGCHLPSRCDRLIRLAAERSIQLPASIMVCWHCRVEQGTRLKSSAALGLPIESDAYEFDAVSGGASPSSEE